jgi:hypothetical protein
LTKWDEKTRTGSIQFSLDGSFSVGDDQETKWWFTPVKVKLLPIRPDHRQRSLPRMRSPGLGSSHPMGFGRL